MHLVRKWAHQVEETIAKFTYLLEYLYFCRHTKWIHRFFLIIIIKTFSFLIPKVRHIENNILFLSSCPIRGSKYSNMGKLLSKIFGNKEMRILMLGLDAAGKTSILFKEKIFFYPAHREELLWRHYFNIKLLLSCRLWINFP